MTTQTPRINGSMLEDFMSKTVLIVGRVSQFRGDTATIDSQGSVQLQLNPNIQLVVGHATEILGKVNPDLTVKVFVATDFGNNIDFNAVEAVVDATHRHKEIFYSD